MDVNAAGNRRARRSTLGRIALGAVAGALIAALAPAMAAGAAGTVATAVALTSSANPSASGEAVTFTAFVSVPRGIPSGASEPSGTVTFSNGSTSLGSGTLDPRGEAVLTTTKLPAGSDTVKAAYGGSTAYATSSATFSETVSASVGAPSATELGFSPSPVTSGQPEVLTAVVSAQGSSSSVPTGNVVFSSGSTTLGTKALSSGAASLTLSSLPEGEDIVDAAYQGSSTFAASEANAPLEVVAVPVATSVQLTSSVNPAISGDTVTFSAFVDGPGGSFPTGSVTFSNGTTSLGTATLKDGAATLSTSSLSVGDHVIAATYAGDSSYAAGGTAITETITSTKAPTEVTVYSSWSPAPTGSSVTLSAYVSPSDGVGEPTGTVTFTATGTSGSTALGSATLASPSSVASVSTSKLAAGTYQITAVYGGDSANAGSTGETVQAVTSALLPSTTTISSSVDPSSTGQAVTFTASVASGSGPAPAGSVTFTNGTTKLATVTLASGSASLTKSFSTVGTDEIEASYSGSSIYAVSSSAVSQVVGSGPLPVSFTAADFDPDPGVVGQPVTFSADLADASGAPVDGGTLTISTGGATLGSAPVVDGYAQLSASFAAAGSDEIDLVYSGTSEFTATEDSFLEVVQSAPLPTETQLTSSLNPSVQGQPVVLSAYVQSDTYAGAPEGTVTFKNGSTTLGVETVGDEGYADLTTTGLPTGTDTITASFSGAGYGASTASNVQTVGTAHLATATTVYASPARAVTGESVSLSASVEVPYDYGQVPTGVVTFASGSTTLGTAALVYGYASISTTALPAGSDPVTVTYAGDQFFASSAATVTEDVTSSKSSLQLSLGTTPDPSVSGQPVTLEVTFPVDDATGTVSFKDGSTSLGTALVVSPGSYFDNEATLQVSSLPAGTDVLTANYSGSSFYDAGSAVITQTVSSGALATSEQLSAGADPVAAGQGVTFVDVVTPTAGAAPPTGTVTFTDGSSTLATVPVSSGYYGSTASYSTDSLAAGGQTIKASYSGDANSAPSSADISEVVQAATSTDATTVYLTSASNPSVAGASVYFVASVSAVSGGATPVGNVVITDAVGGTTLLLASGNISPSEQDEYFFLPLTTAGTNVITAAFSGDTNWLASQTTLIQTVTTPQAATLVDLSSSANPSRAGQPVTFTASVTPQEYVGAGYGYVPPTGSVTFLDGSTTLGTADLFEGEASLTTSGLAAGNASISAVYAGDANYTTSQSSLGQQVSSTALSSSVVVSGYPINVLSGQPVSLEASVFGPAEAALPTGSVTFKVGSTTLGVAPVSEESAELTTSALPTGSDTVTASYGGDVNYAPASSTTQLTVTTTKFATTIELYQPGTVAVGQPLSLEAYVESETGATPTPTGTLTFTYGSTTLGTLSLSGGFAALTTSSLPAGTDTVDVAYSGDGNFTASTGSVEVAVSASKLATTTSLTTNASDVTTSQPVTLTASVYGPGGSSTPTGSVTFTSGSTTLGAATLQDGTAELTLAGLPAASTTLDASYSGDGNFSTSSGSTSVTVSSATLKSKTTLASAQKTSSSGQAVTFVATVSGPAGSEPPTGTVTFTYGSTVLGAVPLSLSSRGGEATRGAGPDSAPGSGTSQAVLTTSALPVGKDSVKASYGGSTAYGTSSGTASETVGTALLAPSVAMYSSNNPSATGQAVTFTVTVSPPGGDSDLPSGTVAFSSKNGSKTTSLGTLALSSEGDGVAEVSLVVSSLAKGSDTVTAGYSGDSAYNAATTSLTQVVDTTLSTTTTLSATPSVTYTGQAVTLTASVTSTGGNSPTGDVVFTEGSTTLGSAALVGGEATLVTPSLPVGADTVTGSYQPGPYFGASSGTTPVSVSSSKLATTTAVYGSSESVQGEVDQISVEVSGNETGESTPTGTVTLTTGSTSLGSAPIQYGYASFNVSTLPVGTDTVKASYSGDADFKTSSGTMQVTVVEAGYWLSDSAGDVYPFGSASTFSVASGSSKASGTIIGMAPTPDGQGYYLASTKGKVFSYGDATPPTTSCPTASDYVALAANPYFEGLWLVQANGQVCALGGADSLGPTSGTTLSGTVVGIASTTDGSGLYLVTNNGSVYAYGDATDEDFGGLSSGTATNIVGMALSQYGEGYWLVSATGVIYPFGEATSFGSTSGTLPGPIVGITATADQQGYYMVTDTGKLYAFGDAISYGDRSTDGKTNITTVAAVPAEE
jgi:large repetitive protein